MLENGLCQILSLLSHLFYPRGHVDMNIIIIIDSNIVLSLVANLHQTKLYNGWPV